MKRFLGSLAGAIGVVALVVLVIGTGVLEKKAFGSHRRVR